MKIVYKLKNRFRFYTFIAVLLIILSSLFITINVYASRTREYMSVTIKLGDTLWGIANKYSKGGDIREYIYETEKLNNLNDGEIYTGMDLKLPIGQDK